MLKNQRFLAHRNRKAISRDSMNFQGKINNLKEEINGYLNPDFNDSKEIVIRKSDFVSERTLVVNANKGACELKKGFVELLKNSNNKLTVILV